MPTILEGLRVAENRIKVYQTEHAVVVTEDGRERGEKDMGIGKGRSRVSMGIVADAIEQNHPIFTHNHPPAVGAISLSYVDIYTGLVAGFSEIRAVNRYDAVHSIRFDKIDKKKRIRIAKTYMLLMRAIGPAALILFVIGPFLVFAGLGLFSGVFSMLGMALAGAWFYFNMQPALPMRFLFKVFGEEGKVDAGSTMIGERLEVPPTWTWNDNGAGTRARVP